MGDGQQEPGAWPVGRAELGLADGPPVWVKPMSTKIFFCGHLRANRDCYYQ